jgi:hypothetical protein
LSSGEKALSVSAHKKRIGRFICAASSSTSLDGCPTAAAFIVDDNSG